jgi:GT2 family glycosyltransferase
MKISVVIPVYKQVPQFIENLRKNFSFINDCEIIVINDDPSESIQTNLQKFPNVILIENKTNLGFGPTVNTGIKKASNDYILLLNSDVILLNDSFKNALLSFKDKTVFAISFAQKEKNGDIVGKNSIYWKKGFLQHSKAKDLTTGENGWAEGGSCLIDRNKFLALNGFDALYSPFYWEDIDLSYRAWKQGFRVLFDASVVVEHHHETTIGSLFKKNKIKEIAYRNQLLCIWKNISDTSLLLSHIFYLKLFILKSVFNGDISFLKAYVAAIGKLPQVLSKRNSKNFIRTDHEIFSKFL